jgi:hypothetical protein
MTGTPTSFENLRFDASSIVTNTQAKLSQIVSDFHFDVLTFGMR